MVGAKAKDWMGSSNVKRPSRPHDAGMSSPDNLQITLELEAGADPIRGTIGHGDGSRRRFWGWLELMDELRHIAAGDPKPPPSPPGPADGGRASEPDISTNLTETQ